MVIVEDIEEVSIPVAVEVTDVVLVAPATVEAKVVAPVGRQRFNTLADSYV